MGFENIFNNAKELNEKHNCLVTLCEEKEAKEGKLTGVPFVCEDNILTKDVKTACGSKMLADFVPFMDAKAVELLNNEGALLVGKAEMDEFGFGLTNGCATSVACGQSEFAIGTEVRVPAALNGVVGVKPSYEVVSKLGLVACVSSMECIGAIAKDVKTTANVLSVISENQISNEICEDVAGLKIGMPAEIFAYANLDEEIANGVKAAVKALEEKGAVVVPVTLPNFASEKTVYDIIATAEISSNFAKIDGVKYGFRAEGNSWEEIFINSRSEGFGTEAKKRIIKGTYFMSDEGYNSYLIPAQQMRTQLIADYNNAFEQCDVIVAPTVPAMDLAQREDADVFAVGASICGLPAISVPVNGTGVQVIAKRNNEENMFKAAIALENIK